MRWIKNCNNVVELRRWMICESFAGLFWIVVKLCTHDHVTKAHQYPLDHSCSGDLRSFSAAKVARYGTRHVTGTVATATGVAARVSLSTPSGSSGKIRAECSNNLGARQRRDCCPRHLGGLLNTRLTKLRRVSKGLGPRCRAELLCVALEWPRRVRICCVSRVCVVRLVTL